jgi:hypothetical protein
MSNIYLDCVADISISFLDVKPTSVHLKLFVSKNSIFFMPSQTNNMLAVILLRSIKWLSSYVYYWLKVMICG